MRSPGSQCSPGVQQLPESRESRGSGCGWPADRWHRGSAVAVLWKLQNRGSPQESDGPRSLAVPGSSSSRGSAAVGVQELQVLTVPGLWQSQALAVSGIRQPQMHNSPGICLTCGAGSARGPTVLGAQRPEGRSVLAVWLPSGARKPQYPPDPEIQQLQMPDSPRICLCQRSAILRYVTAPVSSCPAGLKGVRCQRSGISICLAAWTSLLGSV